MRCGELLEAHVGDRLGHRQLDEQRADAVAEREPLRGQAHVHRHHGSQAVLGEGLAAVDEQAPQSRGAGGEHDVVDRASEPVADRPHVGQRNVNGRISPRGADRDVERAVWCADQLVVNDQVGERARAHERLTRVQRGVQPGPCGGDAHLGGVSDRGGRLGHERTQQGGPAVVLGEHGDARTRSGVGLGVEQQVSDVHRADAVDQAVVGLPGQRPAAIGQPLEQHHLPERARPVEPM